MPRRILVALCLSLLPLASEAAQVSLQWDTYAAAKSTGLRLERSTNQGANWSPVQQLATTATQWTDTTVETGKTYWYRLIAVGAAPLGDSAPSATVQVTVVAGPTVTLTPMQVAPGKSVAVTWANIQAPNTMNFVTLNRQNAEENDYIRYQRTSGAAGGTLTFAIPASVTPGTYELRLYANDNYLRLATSAPFTVGTAPPPTLPALTGLQVVIQ